MANRQGDSKQALANLIILLGQAEIIEESRLLDAALTEIRKTRRQVIEFQNNV
jgi:hypothetical protein